MAGCTVQHQKRNKGKRRSEKFGVLMFESFHEKEQSELDFTSRLFAWESHDQYQWVCQCQSAEGPVCLEKKQAIVVRPRDKIRHSGKSRTIETI